MTTIYPGEFGQWRSRGEAAKCRLGLFQTKRQGCDLRGAVLGRTARTFKWLRHRAAPLGVPRRAAEARWRTAA